MKEMKDANGYKIITVGQLITELTKSTDFLGGNLLHDTLKELLKRWSAAERALEEAKFEGKDAPAVAALMQMFDYSGGHVTDDPCAEARARVLQWEMKVEALIKKRAGAAMERVIEAGVLGKLDAELAEAKKHLYDAEAELKGCVKDSGARR